MEPTPLHTLREPGPLREPALVVSLVRRNGFNSTARASVETFANRHDPVALARIDSDPFLDYTIAPPSLRLSEGKRTLDWPDNELLLLQPAASGRDIITLAGIEPHLRWPTFLETVATFVANTGIRRLLVVRTWPARVPHTRPLLLRLTTDSQDLASGLKIDPVSSTYEGPTDCGGALMQALAETGVEGAGLMVFVPNYLGVVPNPHAMSVITRALDRLAGTATDLEEVERTAEELTRRANQAMDESDELRSAVAAMEEQYEAMEARTQSSGQSELPSPEEAIGDVERFLRGEQ